MKSEDRADKSGVVGKLYSDGEVIYRQGERGDSMYVVESGQVELLQRRDEKEYCLAVLGTGEFFGYSGLLAKRARSVTARALGNDTCVFRLQRKEFMQRAHEDPSLMFNLVEHLMQRIWKLEAALVRVGETSLPTELQTAVKKTNCGTGIDGNG